jgi:hypothetical protein
MVSPEAMALLKRIQAVYPNALTTEAGDETAAHELRDAALIELWDMWPDGRERWTTTGLGRTALAHT